MTNETTAKKPVQKFRSGAIEVAVWSKTGEKGSFYSVTMSRSYKQRRGMENGRQFQRRRRDRPHQVTGHGLDMDAESAD